MKCPQCGCEDIDCDNARGDAACVDCGHVLEQNLIVNEVAFAEDARGRSNLVGQHVRADGRINSFGVLPGFSREAAELTMQNGRRRLAHLVSALRLKTRHTDAAVRMFRLAVDRNFHKGRRMVNVCCACLYVVCRNERTPHMLLDFADVLETNVYTLGHTFLKFAQLLSLNLPIVDPSLYIHRFAGKLEFGERTHTVAMSALRIMARMQRNWMSAGRRPSGLCGAALLIAARMHNFYRSQSDVARVVRIGNVVLRERLQELDKTPTAALTAVQIDAGGGDDGKEDSLAVGVGSNACDPPAFQRSQARKISFAAMMEKQVDSDVPAGDHIATLKGGTAMENAEDPEETVVGDSQPAGKGTLESQAIRIAPGKSGRTSADAELEGELQAALNSNEIQELEHEGLVEEALRTGANINGAGQGAGGEAGAAGKGNDVDAAELADIETVDDDRELSDLDDDDAEKYINTEEEYERKKELWTEVNKEYLEKQERMERLKRERPEEYKRLRPWRSQKKKKADPSSKAARDSENDEEVQAPAAPKTSRKINYSVLQSLGQSSSSLLGSETPAGSSGRLPPLPPPRPAT